MIICTENHGAADGVTGGNPVVDALLEWRPTIQSPSNDLATDISIILGAK